MIRKNGKSITKMKVNQKIRKKANKEMRNIKNIRKSRKKVLRKEEKVLVE